MRAIEPSREQLNSFVEENNGSFQQSWEWGELQEQMNRPVTRFFLLSDNQKPVAAATFIRHDIPIGKYYWLCPRGPVLALQENLQLPITNFQNLGGIFIRIEPEILVSNKLPSLDSRLRRGGQATSYKLVKAPHDHNPRATILINMQLPEKEMLQQMHHKTRYNIRLAEKKNITVRHSALDAESSVVDSGSEAGMTEGFVRMLKATSGRGGFHLHPAGYYEELLKLPFVQLFGAYYKDEMVAGAIISVFGDRATYLHGASDYNYRKLMAPYLLHWQIIGEMKKQGMKYYDFGGVSPESDPVPEWEGITRFKKGFGGVYEEQVGSLDYVLKPFWYFAYKIGRKIL